MEKIQFKSNEAPYLSAENLNQLQTNIEDAINGIVESGSNENGSWVKYADGTMIICQRFTRSYNTSVQSGSLYWGRITDIPEFPQAFTEIQTTQIRGENNSCVSLTANNLSMNKIGTDIYPWTSTAVTTPTAINIHILVIGKWK